MFLVKLKKQPKKKELCVTEKNKRFNPKFFLFLGLAETFDARQCQLAQVRLSLLSLVGF